MKQTEHIFERHGIQKGHPNYDLINELWLYSSGQKEVNEKDIPHIADLINKTADLINGRQTSFTITKDNFVEVLNIKGKTVLVGLDDPGQCYYFEWLEDGEINSASCGTYNFDYKSEIEDFFEDETESIDKRLREFLEYSRHNFREFDKRLKKLEGGDK